MRDYRSMTPWKAFLMLVSAPMLWAQTPPASAGWVVIPVGDYTALRARTLPAPPPPETPPVAATLSRVEYDLRVGDLVASGQAVLTIDVLKEGWVRVPIPGGLMVRDAVLGGKPATLDAESTRGGRQPMVVLSKRGRSTLTLQVSLPIATTAGEESLRLPPSLSGVTRAAVVLSRPDLDLRVEGGLIEEKTQTAGATRWLAYGRGNEPLTIAWRRKVETTHTTLPLRLRGSLTQVVSLGEDSTSLYAEVALEVVQGAATQARVQVPPGVTINQVSGPAVADWEVRAGVLTVQLLEPADHAAAFTISGETHLARQGELAIPLLALQDTERDSGGVAVDVLGAGEIKQVQAENLERVDAADLGQAVQSRQSPSLTAFRYRLGGPRTLRLQLTRYEQQAVLTANVDEARYRVLLTADGKALVQARYAVRNNQRSYLKVALPASSVLWSASMAGRVVKPGQAPDGALLLPLAKARAGEDVPAFVVELLYLTPGTAWAERGRAAVPLPLLDLPVSKTGTQIYYPPMVRLTVEPGVFRTEEFQPPAAPVLNGAGAPVAELRAAPRGSSSGAQALVDRYNERAAARRSSAAAPMPAAFPEVGPSVFLAAELTGENQPAAIEVSYQPEKKRGDR